MLIKPSNMKHREKRWQESILLAKLTCLGQKKTTAIPDDVEETQTRVDGKSQLQSFAAFFKQCPFEKPQFPAIRYREVRAFFARKSSPSIFLGPHPLPSEDFRFELRPALSRFPPCVQRSNKNTRKQVAVKTVYEDNNPVPRALLFETGNRANKKRSERPLRNGPFYCENRSPGNFGVLYFHEFPSNSYKTRQFSKFSTIN